MQRNAFAGKVNGQYFGLSVGHPARFDITKIQPMLEDPHERLAGVTIECLPWQTFVTRYDHSETLFYLDPPYYGCEDYYGAPFQRAEFEELSTRLQTIKGQFIMSLNAVPEVRDIFSWANVEEAEVRYHVAGHKRERRMATEVPIPKP